MEWVQGQKLQTCRWFHHFFPGCWPLCLAVVEGYDSRREILSSESGVSYIGDHTIRMVESTAGFEYSDDVGIHAGLKTFFIWLYAKVFCRYQQARRRRLKSPL